MVVDVLHLLCPTAVIHAECFDAAVAGNLVEAGLREQKQCSARGLLQPEFNERGRFFRVIYFGIYGIRVPGKGKEPFGLHFLTDVDRDYFKENELEEEKKSWLGDRDSNPDQVVQSHPSYR